jgi:hypothetical protein
MSEQAAKLISQTFLPDDRLGAADRLIARLNSEQKNFGFNLSFSGGLHDSTLVLFVVHCGQRGYIKVKWCDIFHPTVDVVPYILDEVFHNFGPRKNAKEISVKLPDCNCVDCGGKENYHDPDCEYMKELTHLHNHLDKLTNLDA